MFVDKCDIWEGLLTDSASCFGGDLNEDHPGLVTLVVDPVGSIFADGNTLSSFDEAIL